MYGAKVKGPTRWRGGWRWAAVSAQGFEFKDRLFPIWEECLGGMHVKRHRAQSVCDTGQHQSEGRAKSAVKHDGIKGEGQERNC